MNNIAERLSKLRDEMQREHLGAVIIPTTDPHHCEHTADHWKGCEWISGFRGSAGTAVVTLTSAALWTDSRYFLATEEQLQGTEFQLMKERIAGTPTIVEWIDQEIMQSRHPKEDWTEVAIDGRCSSVNEVRTLIADLRKAHGITLRTNFDPLKLIWKDRPAIPDTPVSIPPLEYAGEPTREKISRIRLVLHQIHADGMLVTRLDDIAWTLTPEVQAYLKAEDIRVEDYEQVENGLKKYFEYNILLDPDEVNFRLYEVVRNKGKQNDFPSTEIVEAPSPIPSLH